MEWNGLGGATGGGDAMPCDANRGPDLSCPPIRGARVRFLNLIKQHVDLLLHAQHVRGLALFDLFI